ncbi:MAG: hypothetical protein ACI910_003016 [Oleispira sp.]|jgi:hypothetical protein
MIAYFIISISMTALVCYGAYRILQKQVDTCQLTLDDAKGYYLIAAILIGFLGSAISFYIGQVLGYSNQEESSSAMALAILLDIMAALLTLIWGLVTFHQPEKY